MSGYLVSENNPRGSIYSLMMSSRRFENSVSRLKMLTFQRNIMHKFLILIIVMAVMIGQTLANIDCAVVGELEGAWSLCSGSFKDCLKRLKDEYGKAYSIQSKICKWCAAVDICKGMKENNGNSALENAPDVLLGVA
uniref:Uncharacterized protein n=1 Tax=Glossina austeni TaxID=7395 RepID=A0A1A9UR85_GLOAU